jgi:DNA ligase 1
MQFHELAVVLERLESISARNEITAVLGNCFKELAPEEAKIVAYLVLGEVGPTYAGLQFNVAEKGLLKMVASLYGRRPEDLKELLAQAGDLGSVVQHLGSLHAVQAGIESFDTSVLGVYRFLLDVQAVSGTGGQEKKEQLLSRFIRCCDSLSLKYLFRIILGNLRLGFSDMTLLDVFSHSIAGDKSLRADLEQAFNVCVDVGVLIKVLKRDGIDGVRRMSMTPGIPVRPSAAERLDSAKAIVEKLGPCVAQPKLDGFRLQVHIIKNSDGVVVNFFSRNMQDMSAMFPDLRQLVEKLDVQTSIFEGEAIACDINTGAFLPFQETVKRKRKHGIDDAAQEYPLKLFAFDLLYLNGESCLGYTHHERRQKLGALLATLSIADKENLALIEELPVTTPEELENYFYKNIAHGLEGLVVKREDALYMPGKRNFNWIKLKRQETGSLDDTIDCVILGYYAGAGKRAKFGMGALLVGVYDPVADVYQTVAKIGTGMSDIELVGLREACDVLKVSHRPAQVECGKDLEPDVWIQPRTVCMIRADEITFSPAHKAATRLLGRGLALRFPRYMGPRPDKAATDATTVEELVTLFKQQKVRKA